MKVLYEIRLVDISEDQLLRSTGMASLIRAAILILCISYGIASTQVVLYQETTNITKKVASLSLSPTRTLCIEDRICKTHQTIETAHEENDVDTIHRTHEWLSSLELTDIQWKHCSDQLSTCVGLSSPHWRNWYNRWVKWENQSYREAVLSALFFPQKAYLEEEEFGSWEGNQAVNYSLAISATHYNPQAQLYHLIKFSYLYDIPVDNSDLDNPVETINTKIKNMFRRDILTSQTLMAKELVGIAQKSCVFYGIPTNREASKQALEELAEISITAFSELISYQEKSRFAFLREQAGDRGIKSEYLTAIAFVEDQNKELELCTKAGNIGLKFKWEITRKEEDFSNVLSYYQHLGENNPKGYYQAALLLLDKSDLQPLSPQETILVVDYLKWACCAGVPGSDTKLGVLTFENSSYGHILSAEEKVSLRTAMPDLNHAFNQARKNINAKIQNLDVLSKV